MLKNLKCIFKTSTSNLFEYMKILVRTNLVFFDKNHDICAKNYQITVKFNTKFMKNFLFLADGFEEIEALATVDVLRRAGMEVTTVSINCEHAVTGAHGLTVMADATFKEADFSGSDWLILPGGMPGASNLHNMLALNDLLKVHAGKGRISAICASPAVVLAATGLLNGKEATCYPGFEDALVASGARHSQKNIVLDGNILTANGPATAIPFALEIVRLTKGDEVAESVASGMLWK